MNIAAYPKHHSFKPSGFDWIGNVPEHWDVEKLGSMLTAVSEKNRPDLPLLSITREQGVIERDVDDQDSNHNFIPDDLSDYKVLREGQFGMNKMKAWQGSYGVSAYTGIVSPAYFIFDFAREVDPHFFNIAIRSKLYVSYFGSASDGVRVGQWDLNQSRMRQIPILLPPLPEQRAIAAFLDGKCATIDEAVRIKEEQIRLLAERRQILIQEAVTRGLNPNASMKDSGIDWIGQIPAHWEKSKLKYVLDTWTGYAFSSAAFCQDGIPILRIGDLIAWGNVSTEKAVCLPEKFARFDEQFGVRKGDILMAMTGGTIGKVSIYDSDQPALLNQRVCAFRPKGVFPLPLALYWMQTKLWDQHILLNSEGGAQPNISDKATIEMPIVLPPSAEERLEIISFLSSSLGRIGDAISLKKSQIAALREYKASLINAAVTGKIKVL
ncbi:restriction endonuclease subunit S [Bombella apis]|uniref:Restriction endonuclease subunit S n=1 Tax=Bombella apis TaxID=1785988 RepID=A0ABR9MNY1_9PROT|nr:restriction endonuclease subunit S [Bombella apis]MBE1723224.1 restriction endonuclease subunit S [Bombella apis]MBR9731031.1 restriction endonuclease subunit S [Bombella apis]